MIEELTRMMKEQTLPITDIIVHQSVRFPDGVERLPGDNPLRGSVKVFRTVTFPQHGYIAGRWDGLQFDVMASNFGLLESVLADIARLIITT